MKLILASQSNHGAFLIYRMSIHFTNILFLTRVIRLYTSPTSVFLIDWTQLRKLYTFFNDQGIKVIYHICSKRIAGTIYLYENSPGYADRHYCLVYVALLK